MCGVIVLCMCMYVCINRHEHAFRIHLLCLSNGGIMVEQNHGRLFVLVLHPQVSMLSVQGLLPAEPSHQPPRSFMCRHFSILVPGRDGILTTSLDSSSLTQQGNRGGSGPHLRPSECHSREIVAMC